MTGVGLGDVEARLIAAFDDVRSTVVEHPDLFERVERSIEDAAARRRFRRMLAGGLVAFVAANVGLALVLSEHRNGRFTMPWWVVELITDIVLIAIAIALGPFIKRFGRAYAADVFQDNPRTGKSYLVLTDVAYYLIFSAFILFTMQFHESPAWRTSRADLLEHQVSRVAGILLIMGILHSLNVIALPLIANLLSSGARSPRGDQRGRRAAGPIEAGAWLLRIEPASHAADGSPEPGDQR